jgi:hypothetical protein
MRRVLATLLVGSAVGLDNGLGLTPPMGYNAYDHVGCCASELSMKEQADAIVKVGDYQRRLVLKLLKYCKYCAWNQLYSMAWTNLATIT